MYFWQSYKGNNSIDINARVTVMHYALRLMLIGIYTKSLKDILNSFQFTEQAQFVAAKVRREITQNV